MLPSAPPGASKWIADPAGTAPDRAVGSAPSHYLAVGPEGGWSDHELSLSRAAGWHAVSLGTRILRIETACLALAAILSQEM